MKLTDRVKSVLTNAVGVVDVGYLRKWLTLAVLIGVIAGVGSILFHLAINWATSFFLGMGAGYVPPGPGGEGPTVFEPIARNWMIPIVCTLGGLLSGLIVFRFAPEAEGHGTDAAINSFHNREGFIRRRIPLVKMIASAITIGSGGSAGREGPVALIGAGFGSTVAGLFRLNSHDRRIALAIGIGAGIGAIFKSPLGGALISAEILYRRDFEFEALLPSFIAAIVGYSIFGSWHGWDPIFTVTSGFSFSRPQELVGYAVLGVVCALVGILYGRTFYKVRDLFRALRIPNYLKPAIGGLLVGVMGMFLPHVLGMGYGWVQFAIDGNTAVLPVGIMIAMVFGKIVATSLSIGSGGSGGVFAPGLVIGGMVGAVVWTLLRGVDGIMPTEPGPFVVLGMMTLFGGVAKAPLAMMIMVSEMTGNYSLLVPSMVSTVIAYYLTGGSYIYENQVNTRADSAAHRAEYSVPLLEKILIADAIETQPVTAPPDLNVAGLANLMKSRKVDAAPVIDHDRLVGIVTTRDLGTIPELNWRATRVDDIMSRKLIVGHPDETLFEALTKMTKANISHLPVVDRERPSTLVGMLAVHNIADTYDLQRRTISAARR